MFLKIKEFFYPGIVSLNISPLDGTLMFYNRVNGLCPPNAKVLDYGASSGDSIKNMPKSKQQLVLLKPNAVSRIGVDVDEGVLLNPYLEKGYLLKEDNHFVMPISDQSVDMVVADWVVEHLPSPNAAFQDIFRVLKPGGWFCARTVNVHHYAFAIANLVKNSSVERRLLNIAQGERYTWPKSYLANTHSKLINAATNAGFAPAVVISWEPEPAYLMKNPILFLGGVIWQKLAAFGILPKATLMLFAQKPL